MLLFLNTIIYRYLFVSAACEELLIVFLGGYIHGIWNTHLV